MSEKIDTLYELERSYIKGIISEGHEDASISLKINSIMSDLCEDFPQKALKSVNQILKLSKDISFSTNFLSTFTEIDASTLNNYVNESVASTSKAYVEKLLNTDLSKTKIIFLDKSIRQNVEGFAVACSNSDHHIFIQNDDIQVISTDLLIHELGHTAEFTISRARNEEYLITKHSTISESIAYYCQYKYLLENGTKDQRKGLFGAFFFTYLSIKVCWYCLEKDIKLSELQSKTVASDLAFQKIVNAYKYNGIEFVEERIEQIKSTYEDLSGLVFNEICPRFGMIVALALLEKDSEVLKSLMQNNSINNDLHELLLSIDSEFPTLTSNLEVKFTEFIDGVL